MQTFLPFADFRASARALDMKRLGKQRVETYQLLLALKQPATGSRGWTSHPAFKQWVGFELALLKYQEAVCAEWVSRGYRDSTLEKSRALFTDEERAAPVVLPEWIGLEKFHASHRSNLLRKDKNFYQSVFPGERDDLPYFWPSKEAL